MSSLNTTSFAILGLLAKRDWSSYELTEYFRRSVIYSCWPRAASCIYREQKKLASLNLVKARQDTDTGRRTIYSITKAGRKALEQWLIESDQSGKFQYEYESLVKFLFCDHNGSVQEQATNIAEEAANEAKLIGEIVSRQLSPGWGVEEDHHLNIDAFRFLVDLIEARVKWAKESNMKFSKISKNSKKALTKKDLQAELEVQLDRLNAIADMQSPVDV